MRSLTLLGAVLFLGSAAHASIVTYSAILNGANENPPTGSPATGTASFTVDNILNTINIHVSFSGLTTNDTAAHIHCCVAPGGNAGVATTLPAFAGFPLGVTSGNYNMVLSLTDVSFYNPAFVTASGGTVALAEQVLLTGMSAGQTYFNIHTTANPGGEIRGFLAVPAPEPATFLFVGVAIAGLALKRRLRK